MKILDGLRKVFENWLLTESSAATSLCDFERIRYELRPGDVLLIEGRSRVSNVIRMITQSPWTHSCLYIGKLHDIDDEAMRARVSAHFDGPPEKQLVIEGMLGEGTIVTNLTQYRDAHIRICRPRGLSRQDSQEVVSFAIEKLGTEYDVRQILDLARFFLPWAMLPRRWRSSIFSQQPGSYTKTVCSTVLAEAFHSVSFPIMPLIQSQDPDNKNDVKLIERNPRLYTPRDFDYSPYFEIIKYPFIQTVEHGIYRQLPWNRDMMHNDGGCVINPSDLPTQPISRHSRSASRDAKPQPKQWRESISSPPAPKHLERERPSLNQAPGEEVSTEADKS